MTRSISLLLIPLLVSSGCTALLRDDPIQRPRVGEALYSPTWECVEMPLGALAAPPILGYGVLLLCTPLEAAPGEPYAEVLGGLLSWLDPLVNGFPAYFAEDVPVLVDWLEDPRPPVRCKAVRELAAINEPAAQAAISAALLARLDDPEAEVRVAVLGALAWRGDPLLAIPPVLERLADPARAVRCRAAEVLPELARKLAADERPRWVRLILEALAARLAIEGDARVRRRLIAAQRALGGGELHRLAAGQQGRAGQD